MLPPCGVWVTKTNANPASELTCCVRALVSPSLSSSACTASCCFFVNFGSSDFPFFFSSSYNTPYSRVSGSGVEPRTPAPTQQHTLHSRVHWLRGRASDSSSYRTTHLTVECSGSEVELQTPAPTEQHTLQ